MPRFPCMIFVQCKSQFTRFQKILNVNGCNWFLSFGNRPLAQPIRYAYKTWLKALVTGRSSSVYEIFSHKRSTQVDWYCWNWCRNEAVGEWTVWYTERTHRNLLEPVVFTLRSFSFRTCETYGPLDLNVDGPFTWFVTNFSRLALSTTVRSMKGSIT